MNSMNISKEENYLSIVLVIRNVDDALINKIKELDDYFDKRFKKYEIVIVDNYSQSDVDKMLIEANTKVTVIELARPHNNQQALQAGVDISIGDFILEIEDVKSLNDNQCLFDMYEASLEGHDFVFYCAKKVSIRSKMFYKMMNNYLKNRINGDINSTVAVLSSRRGQNKTAEMGSTIVNRNLSYLFSGLSVQILEADVRKKSDRGLFEDFELFIDTLIHYTDIIPKIASFISMFFVATSLTFLVYSFSIYFIMGTIEGWASTNTFLAFSFSGIFIMLALLSKYLMNILNVAQKRKSYIFKSVKK